jgi:hypothetical protein
MSSDKVYTFQELEQPHITAALPIVCSLVPLPDIACSCSAPAAAVVNFGSVVLNARLPLFSERTNVVIRHVVVFEIVDDQFQ